MATSMEQAEKKKAEQENDSPSRKKLKPSPESPTSFDNDVLIDFDGFVVDEILSENSQSKTLFLAGGFKDSNDKAVILLEKKPFLSESAHLQNLMSKNTTLKLGLKNDIYGVYEGHPIPELNGKFNFCNSDNYREITGVKTTVIWPATEKHIKKYKNQDLHLLTETWEDYESVTLPYLNEQQFSIQWVFNILDKKAESDRIVYEDPDPEVGFVLLPDMKWDGKQAESLYLIAIIHKRGVKSLRDLTKEHLPMLKNIRQKCLESIKTNYNIASDQLRLYVHYQPSSYHLHVHVTHVRYIAPGSQVEKAHLLTDVIENIELASDYYQKKSLTYALRENDRLLEMFRKAGKLD